MKTKNTTKTSLNNIIFESKKESSYSLKKDNHFIKFINQYLDINKTQAKKYNTNLKSENINSETNNTNKTKNKDSKNDEVINSTEEQTFHKNKKNSIKEQKNDINYQIILPEEVKQNYTKKNEPVIIINTSIKFNHPELTKSNSRIQLNPIINDNLPDQQVFKLNDIIINQPNNKFDQLDNEDKNDIIFNKELVNIKLPEKQEILFNQKDNLNINNTNITKNFFTKTDTENKILVLNKYNLSNYYLNKIPNKHDINITDDFQKNELLFTNNKLDTTQPNTNIFIKAQENTQFIIKDENNFVFVDNKSFSSILNQVKNSIELSVNKNQEKINIKLSPPELGRIEIQLKHNKDIVQSIKILVEKPDTLSILKDNATILKESLTSIPGVENTKLSFDINQNNNNNSQFNNYKDQLNSLSTDKKDNKDNTLQKYHSVKNSKENTYNILV